MESKNDFELPAIRIPADKNTQQLEVRIGKVVWALSELEMTLPEQLAERVRSLKSKVSADLHEIVNEIGQYRTL